MLSVVARRSELENVKRWTASGRKGREKKRTVDVKRNPEKEEPERNAAMTRAVRGLLYAVCLRILNRECVQTTGIAVNSVEINVVSTGAVWALRAQTLRAPMTPKSFGE